MTDMQSYPSQAETLAMMSGLPLTIGEIVTKMLTFAGLTLSASGLLARMAQIGEERES
jgi:hypothetical protein